MRSLSSSSDSGILTRSPFSSDSNSVRSNSESADTKSDSSSDWDSQSSDDEEEVKVGVKEDLFSALSGLTNDEISLTKLARLISLLIFLFNPIN